MRDTLITKRTRRAQLVSVLVAAKERTAQAQSAIAAIVTSASLAAIDAATFGFFNGAAGSSDCSITSGLKVLTSPNDLPWTAADVGKAIDVAGAGAAGGVLSTTIAAFTSAGSVTLADAAATTVASTATSAGGVAIWGTRPALALLTDPLRDTAGQELQSPPFGLPIVDLESFGALGAGNDTTVFQKAIDSLKTGGTIRVPSRRLSLGTLTVRVSGITIVCESPGSILVPEVGTPGFLFDVDLSASVRPFSFRFEGGRIAGDTATRTFSAFKLKHVYAGGVRGTLIQGVDKVFYFSDSYWSDYADVWVEHYNLGLSAESAVYPGNNNTFTRCNFFDGNLDGTARPFDLAGMGNCRFDSCTFGSSADHKVDDMDCADGNLFLECRFESLRSDATSVLKVGSGNRFLDCYFASQDGFGSAIVPGTSYILVEGDNNVIDPLPLKFYGQSIILAAGTRGNDIFFDCTDVTTAPVFADYGDNRLHFDRRDHSSNRDTSSDFAVTNLVTRTDDQATVTVDGLTKTASADVGPFGWGEVYQYDTPTGNRRVYFSLGSIAANEAYAGSVWLKAVAANEIVEIQLDPQETPRQVLIRTDCWTRVLHATIMQGGPFTRRFQITAPADSGGILVANQQVVHLGTAVDGVYPPIFYGGFVPTGGAARTVVCPRHLAQRWSYNAPTLPAEPGVCWSLQAAAGASPGWVYTPTGYKALANLAA